MVLNPSALGDHGLMPSEFFPLRRFFLRTDDASCGWKLWQCYLIYPWPATSSLPYLKPLMQLMQPGTLPIRSLIELQSQPTFFDGGVVSSAINNPIFGLVNIDEDGRYVKSLIDFATPAVSQAMRIMKANISIESFVIYILVVGRRGRSEPNKYCARHSPCLYFVSSYFFLVFLLSILPLLVQKSPPMATISINTVTAVY